MDQDSSRCQKHYAWQVVFISVLEQYYMILLYASLRGTCNEETSVHKLTIKALNKVNVFRIHD